LEAHFLDAEDEFLEDILAVDDPNFAWHSLQHTGPRATGGGLVG
jgi:hypothetical protein